MQHIKADQTSPAEIEPGLFGVRLIDGGTGSHRLSMLKGWLRPGARHSPHVHAEEEAVTFLSGRGMLIIDGRRCAVEKDDTVWIPAGVVHSTENTGDEDLHFVAAFSDSLITTQSVDEEPGGVRRSLVQSGILNRLRWFIRRVLRCLTGR